MRSSSWRATTRRRSASTCSSASPDRRIMSSYTRRSAMKRIGILGGSSDQATAEYYRLLNRAVNERLGGFNTAEVLISSMNFAVAEHGVRQGLWDELGEYLAERA